MNKKDKLEVQQILELQEQINRRFIQLGFVSDPNIMGDLEHHLAELSLWGKKLSQESLPAFLTLPLRQKKELGEVVVDLSYDLAEIKDAIEDMEPALTQLMNY